MNRREFLLVAGGVAGTVAATGSAVAQEGNGSGGNTSGGNASGGGGNESGNASGGGGGGGSVSGPIDYGIEGANGYDGPGSGTDATGQSEVTIEVGVGSGGYAFGPAAVHIDPGTTVIWEWASAGHNVNAQSGAEFESPLQSEGTFEWTAPEDASGIVEYQCDPHVGQGMIAALAIGSDVPTAATGGGAAEEVDPEHMGVPIQAHWVGIATILMIVSSLMFTFFLLKYGESAHTKGGT
ncbi:plastocyanin/azurin family copper-binding protein [Halomarina oriensis]|uniref:Halocyanin n=1 Tax=Halomarina oriensis TaxID=671145 RepID=A0A6B0GMF5_9EURY|nr:plastocyanin/azurin family copper-binding protein [Halomarina oriensis]MWG33305.1 halocyanin [Halomarina oriensis]